VQQHPLMSLVLALVQQLLLALALLALLVLLLLSKLHRLAETVPR
jgi:fumarate reductase subunit D